MSRLIAGYASVFSVPDLAGDVVTPGAFRQSLAGRSAKDIRMLYQHDALYPIGCWHSIRETEQGLWVEGRLTERVQLADEVLALIDDGALDGLSIGFRTRRAEAGQGRVKRRLLDVQLVEVSLVTFPMQPSARLQGRAASFAVQLHQAGAHLRHLIHSSQ